ncbi:Uncharacterised protein [Yersinia pseudotuberculosis]|nr:Uncharacterised protein [Yersinia pseudotuberculosis]
MIKIVFRYLVCDLFGDNTRNTRFNTDLQNLLRYQTSAGCSDTTSLQSQTQRIILYRIFPSLRTRNRVGAAVSRQAPRQPCC